ncbi:ABC transporter permease subunit [Paracoccus sp. S-4012]|uniref:ABC transporter permease n=1 Tax=Paracoccus sp. S-4012 TaxID=2665648 RepID=UPI0012AFC31E|nr:ABC transporter permease [Paracoccus sp. S-4012]MRX52104.1 ABC transporter permease subunit [Paracoccus sp. S-4012]
MLQFLGIRVVRALITMSIVLVIAFLTVRYSGEPFDAMYPEGIPPEMEEALREEWNLNLPIWDQFSLYIGNMLRGDFGRSIFTNEEAWRMYAERMPATLAVGGLAFLLAVMIGIPMGAFAALHRESAAARGVMWIAFLGYAVPHFVLGIGLVLLFGFHWKLLPTSGLSTPWHYILPVVTLAIPMIAAIARFMRVAMLDAVAQAHVGTAQAKGLTDGGIARWHILRNAMVPLLTVLGLEVAGLMNGSIFVEAVFSLPGVGRVLVNAVLDRDFAVLQFGVLAYAAIIVLITLMIDILYAVADPRVRLEA